MGETRNLIVQSDYHKVQIPLDEIMYITIDGRKTRIARKNGSAVKTNRSLKDIFAELPEDRFSSVNRGIVVAHAFVRHEKAGVITMKDGTQFKRRVRSDRLKARPKVPVPAPEPPAPCPAEDLDRWLGSMPAPMCILELSYREPGGSAAFVIRWCNEALAELEGSSAAALRGRPLTALEHLGDAKWLGVFADVAINGGVCTREELWDDGGRFFRLQCYQPRSGCCAVILADLTRENNLVRTFFHGTQS